MMTYFEIIGIFIALIMLVGFVYETASFVIKSRRCRRWYSKHDGWLIGGEEFQEWCFENGVDPSYFI